MCEGEYDREYPTDAMLQASAEILAHGAQVHGADPQQITGHRDLAAATCPRDHLYARLGELRAEVLRLASAPLALDLVGGAEAQARLERCSMVSPGPPGHGHPERQSDDTACR